MTTDHRPTNNRKSNTVSIIAIGLITLLAFALRIYRLDAFSLRGDEAFTVIFVQRTWEGLWKGISAVEPNPPLMYLALRAWVAVAGASEFATRYFSLWFGVLGVPLIYRLAKEMFGARNQVSPRNLVSVLAAAILAINPYQIWHAQDVRNYTLWPSLSLLALIFFWRWFSLEIGRWTLEIRKRNWRFGIWDLGFYILATLASLYTHYYDVFILVALNLFVFAFTLWNRRWQTLARWIGGQIVLVICYAPWVLFGTNRITTYGEASAEQSVSLLDQFSRTVSAFFLSETASDSLRALIWLPLALIVLAILIYLARRNFSRALFFLFYLSIPTLALYIISIGRPLFLERYLNGVAPAYYLLFAIGLAAIWQSRFKWRVAIVTIAFLLLGASSAYAIFNAQFDPNYAKAPNWRGLTQKISTQPGDIIIQNFTEMSPLYYLGTTTPVLTVPKDFWYTPADEKLLRQLNTAYRRIWFIPAQPDLWDTDNNVEKFLARNDERVSETSAGKLRLQLYLTPREFESKILPVNARIGEATLAGYRVDGARALHLVLYWRVTRKITKDYTVFVHIADANGNVVAQQDRMPAFGTYPTSAWQPGESIVDVYDVIIDAPPANYSIVVGMYDPNTLVRLPAIDSSNKRLLDDQISLTQITIAP